MLKHWSYQAEKTEQDAGMRLAFVLLWICGSSLAGGCSMNYGVMKVGPDTYEVSAVAAPARGGVAGAHEKADEAASQKCQSLGKTRTVTNVTTVHEPTAERAVLTFTCS
jgi:hypothetical protein